MPKVVNFPGAVGVAKPAVAVKAKPVVVTKLVPKKKTTTRKGVR